MSIAGLRSQYHRQICRDIIRIRKKKGGIPYYNFADGDSKASREIADRIVDLLGHRPGRGTVREQTAGSLFESITKDFLEQAFRLLQHIRPGDWLYSTQGTAISGFDQYQHLAYIQRVFKNDKDLSAAMGKDYIIGPDIVVGRRPVADSEINRRRTVIAGEDGVARLTPLRRDNRQDAPVPILHASISCKWTIRSDRAQNTRAEALNLIRNRKGNLPHVVAVTAEPLPTRISALALGTGDLDCVYHFALRELQSAIGQIGNEDQGDALRIMVEGRRLRDISDLPFDLAI